MVRSKYEHTWWDNDNYHWWVKVSGNWIPEWLIDVSH